MSIRVRTGLAAAGSVALILLVASPAAADSVRITGGADGFTPPYASVRITGDDVDNRDYSVRITGADDREYLVRVVELKDDLDNRDFSVAPANREW
ncbi:hypothetical protein [Glycomyces sp. NPDC048151]|uniref:hypothetical protein n=1 Tax=Glycomyces sp. NPDC048151 TaxID=3364002 RepID=UPI003716FDFC